MDCAGTHVAANDHLMKEAQLGLADVHRHGDKVAQMSHDIALATQEQSQAGGEIVRQVEGIAAGIDRTVHAMSEVRGQTVETRGIAGRLRELIHYFHFIH